jgi:hypothetical protein
LVFQGDHKNAAMSKKTETFYLQLIWKKLLHHTAGLGYAGVVLQACGMVK